MFGLSKLFAALRRLAASIESAADTVDEANSVMRSRLMLDHDGGEIPDALADRVTVDAVANGHAEEETEEEPKPKGRGRAKK